MLDKAPTGVAGKLVREVTKEECPWLSNDLREGIAVFDYLGPDFGCCTEKGVMVLLEPNEYPSVEVPKDAVSWS